MNENNIDITGKRIYISGKISGLNEQVARELFEAGAAYLRSKGAIPVNPFDLEADQSGKKWADYMLIDLPVLIKCHGIYMLENWTQSDGAQVEYIFAKKSDLWILHQTDEHLKVIEEANV